MTRIWLLLALVLPLSAGLLWNSNSKNATGGIAPVTLEPEAPLEEQAPAVNLSGEGADATPASNEGLAEANGRRALEAAPIEGQANAEAVERVSISGTLRGFPAGWDERTAALTLHGPLPREIRKNPHRILSAHRESLDRAAAEQAMVQLDMAKAEQAMRDAEMQQQLADRIVTYSMPELTTLGYAQTEEQVEYEVMDGTTSSFDFSIGESFSFDEIVSSSGFQGSGLQHVITAKLGERWEFTDLLPGLYRIEAEVVEGEGYWGELKDIQAWPAEPRDRFAVELYPPARITGTVRSQAGAPIAQASVNDDQSWYAPGQFAVFNGSFQMEAPQGSFKVRVRPGVWKEAIAASTLSNDSPPAFGNDFEQDVQTDARGYYELIHQKGGQVTLHVSAEGYLPYSETLELEKGEQRWHDVTLIPEQVVAGQAFWPDGRPAGGINLFAHTEHQREVTNSDENGNFRFRLRPASLRLFARAGGSRGQDFSRLEFHEAGPHLAHLTVTLEPSHQVNGRVVDEDGAALPNINVTARMIEDSQVTRNGRTGENGEFVVPGMYAGNYEVYVNGLVGERPQVSVGGHLGTPDVTLLAKRPNDQPIQQALLAERAALEEIVAKLNSLRQDPGDSPAEMARQMEAMLAEHEARLMELEFAHQAEMEQQERDR